VDHSKDNIDTCWAELTTPTGQLASWLQGAGSLVIFSFFVFGHPTTTTPINITPTSLQHHPNNNNNNNNKKVG